MLLVSSSCSNSISVSISIRRWITVRTPIGSCCISSLLICTSHCKLFLSLETLFENEWYLVAANCCHCKCSLSASLSLSLCILLLWSSRWIFTGRYCLCVLETPPISPPSLCLPITPKSHPRKSIFSSVKFHLPLHLGQDTVPLSFSIPLPFSLGLFLGIKKSADTKYVSAVSVSSLFVSDGLEETLR